MKKSQLKQIIREILAEERGLGTRDDGDVSGWYWPIADQGMEIIKKKGGDYANASLGGVGDGDGETYISIGIDFPNGTEEHFNVYFDENERATEVESTWSS